MRYLSVPVMLVNIAIIIGIGFAIYLTKNALCIIGLYYLQEMPHYQLSDMQDDEDELLGEEAEEYSSNEIGFTAKSSK